MLIFGNCQLCFRESAMTSEHQPPEPPAENSGSAAKPEIVEKVDPQQMAHFVTEIKSAEQQVGENIIKALQHDGTVAVLTTVVRGPDGQQRVVSAALNPSMMAQVQQVLMTAQDEREPEEPCVGFHCLVKPKS